MGDGWVLTFPPLLEGQHIGGLVFCVNFGGWTASPGDSACFGLDCSRTFKYDRDDRFWFDSVSGCSAICNLTSSLSLVKRRSCSGNPNM